MSKAFRSASQPLSLNVPEVEEDQNLPGGGGVFAAAQSKIQGVLQHVTVFVNVAQHLKQRSLISEVHFNRKYALSFSYARHRTTIP